MPDNAYISTDDNANFIKSRGPHRIAMTGQAMEGQFMNTLTNFTRRDYQLIPDRIKLVIRSKNSTDLMEAFHE